MAKYTKKEFAATCGMTTNALAVYIGDKEKKVILDDDGFIDTDDPVNSFFLQKRIAKGKTRAVPDYNASPVYIPATNTSTSMPDGIRDYEESEKLVKHYDAEKRKKEVEKLEIDIQKKRGEVIPSELIPPVLLQHNQSIITSIKNEHEEWLRNFAKKHDININEVAEIRQQAVTWINTAMQKATAMSINAVDAIVRDYSEKRGIGERL